MYLKIRNIVLTIMLSLMLSNFVFSQTKFDSLISELDKYTNEKGKERKKLEIIKQIFTETFNANSLLAAEYAAMGLQLATELKDTLEMAAFNIYIGDTYFKQKVYYLAMKEYFRAYEIYSEENDKTNLANCFIKVGKTYTAQEVYDIAEDYFSKAKKIYEANSDKAGISMALFNLGISNLIADEKLALDYFYQAAEIQEKINDDLLLAQTKRYIAIAHSQLYETELALENLQQSLTYYKKYDDKYELAETYFTFGEIYFDNEQYDLSLEYYNKALKLYDLILATEKIAETYYHLGEINFYQNKPDAAIEFANKCNEIAEAYNFPELEEKGYYILAISYETKRDFETALSAQKEYVRLINLISEQKKREQFSEFQANLETQKQQKEIEFLEIKADKQKLEDAQIQYKRNILFIIITAILVMGFIVALYFRYREKLKANKLLENSNDLLTKEVEVRRLAEAELKNSEEKYRLLFRKTPIGIMQFNENLHITNVNDRFAEIFKLNRRQLMDVDLATIFDRNVLYSFNNALSDKNLMVSEEREIITNHEVIYVALTIKPYFYTVGNEVVKGGIVIVEDLTEKKKTEKMFDQNAIRKQILLDSYPDNIILVSRKAEIVESHLPDFSKEQSKAKTLKDLFDGDILIEYFITLKNAIEKNIVLNFNYFDPELQKNIEVRVVPESKQNALIIIRIINNEPTNGNGSEHKLGITAKKTPRKNAEDIENAFEKNILPIYKNIQKNLSFILIKGLAEQLKNVGANFKEDKIIAYGDQLLESVTSFNVIKVNEVIKDFPTFAAKYLNNYVLDF